MIFPSSLWVPTSAGGRATIIFDQTLSADTSSVVINGLNLTEGKIYKLMLEGHLTGAVNWRTCPEAAPLVSTSERSPR